MSHYDNIYYLFEVFDIRRSFEVLKTKIGAKHPFGTIKGNMPKQTTIQAPCSIFEKNYVITDLILIIFQLLFDKLVHYLSIKTFYDHRIIEPVITVLCKIYQVKILIYVAMKGLLLYVIK